MRFLMPALFLGAAGYVHWYNQHHLDRMVLRFVFDLLAPSTKGDPITQGRYTVLLLGAIGAFFLLRDVVALLRVNRGVIRRDDV